MSDRILIVDDEAVLRRNLVRFLTREGYAADAAADGEQALTMLGERDYALVVTDLRMPGMGGLALLERIASGYPDTLVLIITAYGSLDSAVEALRKGAQDYLLKPLSLEELAHKVGALLTTRELAQRVRRLRRELHQRHDLDQMVAESSAMREVLALVDKAAPTRSTVLIEGESGTGKELIARALHERAPWQDRDFVPVNLAAQPRELVDAALFGHERGAYTGATGRRDGVFRAARGGTVFLDEIAELPPEIQVKLLRVLESREVLPIGADRPQAVDFRLVVATNRPLRTLVDEGAFRQDLYFRLAVLRITIPPLRDRPDDIPPLAHALLRRHATRQGRRPPELANDVLRRLRMYPWPGNVRELSNVIERALLLCDGDRIEPTHLPGDLDGDAPDPVELREAVARFERRHIARVLADCDGDKTEAADRLGIHLATLYRHLERLGIS